MDWRKVAALSVVTMLVKGAACFLSRTRTGVGQQERSRTSLGSARLFFDVGVDKEEIGRLVFSIPDTTLFPQHTENLIKLCSQERRSIDSRMSYRGCEFQFSPQFIEGFAQYRWAHVLPGRGLNAVGSSQERLVDPDAMRRHRRATYGGIYYGLRYDDIPGHDVDAIVLTIPMTGPGRGSTLFSIVRVAESPREWKERLLMNSALIGWLEPSCRKTLRLMARQKRGPPKVLETGVLT